MSQLFARLSILFSLLFLFLRVGAQTDCNNPASNTPEITGIKVGSPSYCYSSDGSIEMHPSVVGGGSGNAAEWQFRVNNGPWQSSPVYNNLYATSFVLKARNMVTGCETSYSGNPVILTPRNSGGEPVINSIQTTDASFCTNNGAITIDASNGETGGSYLDLRYRLNGGSWTSSNTFTDLTEGVYTIEVYSSNGRCVTTTQTTINKLTAPDISVSTTASSDCSNPNGQITLSATGNYYVEYSIDNGENWTHTPVFSNLSPGTYFVEVRVNGDESCIIEKIAPVGGIASITISSAVSTAASSCSAADGKITISASSSSTLYYKIEGEQWQTSKTITGLVPGSYNVYVKNSSGSCQIAYNGNPVQVPGASSLSVTGVNTAPPTNCGASNANGSITINAQNDGNPILYSIDGGNQFFSNNTFSGLNPGTYEIFIANADQSCIVPGSPVTLTNPEGIVVQNVQITQPTNCSIANGTINIEVSPTGNYQYSIDGGQSFQPENSFPNLSQGSYQIVVMNPTTGCSTATSITIQALQCTEICNDGIDNDGNGMVDDCPDSNCGTTGVQVQITQTYCGEQPAVKGSISVTTDYQTKDCSTLQAGDIVFTEYHAEPSYYSLSTDRFSFVPLVNIAGGTQLIFTDKGWISSTSGFRSGEGVLQWTAPSGGVTAGTEITINVVKYGSTITASASSGTVKKDNSIPNAQAYGSNLSYDLDPNGDQIIALCGSSFAQQDLSQIIFLAAIYANGTSWDATASSTATSAIPPGLTDGTTAVAVGDVSTASLPTPDNTIMYSINDGQSWQAGSTFSELEPGFYQLLIKHGDCIGAYPNNPIQIFGCNEVCGNGIDDDGDGAIDCADYSCGSYPFTVGVTPLACPPASTLGSIAVTIPNAVQSAYQYSIDNGTTWLNSSTIGNLSPGTYQIAVKNKNSGCVIPYGDNPAIISEPVCAEICDDGVDNDQDGLVDCDDPDCGLAADFTVDVTAPTCPFNANNGTIQISAAYAPVFKDCSNLKAGDIAITFYDASPNQFAFVPRVNIAEGTKIIFTDKGYQPYQIIPGEEGGQNYTTIPEGMRNAEGLAQWTAPTGGVLAGMPITITVSSSSTDVGTVLFDEAIPNYQAYDTNPNFSLASSGDQLIALCGNSFDLAQVTFLFAVHANGTTWDTDASSDAKSAIPPGLIDGVTAIAVGDVGEATIPLAPIPAPPTYAYSLDGGQTYDTTGIFSNLAAGTYNILIKNQDTGCELSYSNEPIVLEAPNCPEICDNGIDDDGNGLADCDDPGCGVASYGVMITQPGCPPNLVNGTITITPYGEANYQFSIDDGATWNDTSVFADREPGTYQIKVKNVASGCTLAYSGNPMTLQRPFCEEICGDGIDNDFDNLVDCADEDCNIPKIDGFNSTPPTYCYSSNGSITVNAVTLSGTSGIPSEWEYSHDNGVTWQSSNVFTGLAPGTYYLKVRNGLNNCASDLPAQVVILEANQFDFTPSVLVQALNPSFCSGNDGKIILDAFEGEEPYLYRLNEGNWVSTNEFSNLGADTYTFEVSSNGGVCINTVSETLTRLPEIIISDIITNSDCSTNSNEIHIVTTPNTGLQYSIDNGMTWNTSPDFTGLSAGTYQVAVRYNNDNRCIVHHTEAITFDTFAPITILRVNSTATTRCDASDGTLTIIATGNDTMEYRITNREWQTSNQFRSLASGNYDVYVRYANYPDTLCQVAYTADSVKVSTSVLPMIENITFTNPSSCTTDDGTILISPSAVGGYLYSINGGQSFQELGSFSNLAAGTYNIVVEMKGTNCSTTYSNNPVVLEVITQAEICGDGIDNDCNGKTDCEDVVCQPAFFTVKMSSPTCPPNAQHGTITIVPSDSKMYRYSIDDKATWQSSPIFPNTNVDVYSIWIEDVATGCTRAYSGNPMLMPPPACPPTDGEDEDKMICQGECVTIGPEAGPYCYKWEPAEGLNDDDLKNPNPQVCPTRTTTYKLQITDDQGNKRGTHEVTVVVKPTPTVTITPSDAKVCNGVSVTLQASAGFTTYAWSNGATTQTIQVQTPGTYSVTVTNSLGCEASANVEVQGSNLSISITPSQATICAEPVTLEATPGFLDYTWKDESGEEIEFQSTVSVEEPGTYTVEVMDEVGCTATASVTVNAGVSNISVTPNPAYLCLGGTVTLTASEGYTSYEWKNAGGNILGTNRTFEADRTGTYTLTATNANGCIASTTVEVEDSKASSVEITPPDPSICMIEEGEPPALTSKKQLEKRLSGSCQANDAVLSVGDGFTNYEWSTGDVGPAIIVNTTGIYSVTVTDVNGCQSIQSVEVTSCAGPGLAITPNPALICADSSITLDAGPGFETYVWSDGVTTIEGQTLLVTAPGDYTVTVTDAGGCMATDMVTVEMAADSAEVDLEIYKPSVIAGNTTTLVADEDNIGGMTFVNLDNDDQNKKYDIDDTSMKSDDDEFVRIRLKLKINNPAASRKVTLSAITGANSIAIWQSADKKMGQFSLGSSIELTQQDGAYYVKDLWVEGILPHTMQRETKLLLLYNSNPNCPMVADTVCLTIVGIDSLEWIGINNNLVVKSTNNGTDYRVFPDAATPGGGARQEVNLKVKLTVPPVENLKIYLRAFDVDDPENKDKQFIDPNDKKNVKGMHPYEGNAGLTYDENNDNRGMPKEGHLQQDSLIFPANSAVDTIQFQQLSLHPGDNYQIVANGDKDFLNDLRNEDAIDGADIVNIYTNSIVKEPTHYLSPVLTVWRTLHVEYDSMNQPTGQANQASTLITGFYNNKATNTLGVTVQNDISKYILNIGGTNVTVDDLSPQSISSPPSPPSPPVTVIAGRFENGTILVGNDLVTRKTINPLKGNKSKDIEFVNRQDIISGLVCNLVNRTTPTINAQGNIQDIENISGNLYKITLTGVSAISSFMTNSTIEIAGGPPIPIKTISLNINSTGITVVEIISGAIRIPVIIKDDDQDPILLPNLLPLTGLEAYEKAYIKYEVDGGGNDPNDNIPFQQNLYYNNQVVLTNGTTSSIAEIQLEGVENSFRDSRNNESDAYWIAYILNSWQWDTKEDGDSKYESFTMGINSPYDFPRHGYSLNDRSIAIGYDIVLGFQETLRDLINTPKLNNVSYLGNIFTFNDAAKRIIAHEIGHSFGLSHGNAMNPPISEFLSNMMGLMTDEPLKNNKGASDDLIPRHIDILRCRVRSPGSN